MKKGIGYIVITDGLVHLLMRHDKQSPLMDFTAPVASEAEAVDAVMEYAAEHNFELSRCMVSIDGRLCLLKNYNLPFQTNRQIGQVIGFELEDDIPFESEDVVSDFFIGDRHDRKSFVSAAVLQKDTVNSLLSLFEERGVTVEALDVDVAAFARACSSVFSGDERGVGFDVGRNRILFCYLAHGKVRQLAVIPWGKNALIDAVAEAGEIEPDEAAHMLLSVNAEEHGEEEYDLLQAQCRNFLRKMLREGARRLEETAMPEHFIVSGSIVRFHGFRELFSELSQGQLTFWNDDFCDPILHLDGEPSECGLATVYGAIQESGPSFDLRKGEFALPKATISWQREIQVMVSLLVFVCLAWGGGAYTSLMAKKRELAALKLATREVYTESLPDVNSNFAPVQFKSILNARLEALAGSNATRDYGTLTVIETLRQMSVSLGSDMDVELLGLSLDKKRIDFHGKARSIADVESVRVALDETEAFRGVKIRSAVNDPLAGAVLFEVEVLR